jgi:tellurite resistance protein TerC
MLALDLGVFNKRPHEIKLREAAKWAAMWISIGVAFSGVVWYLYNERLGPGAGDSAVQLYLTGFVLEKALSVDNLFVFIIIFTYFDVKGLHQHRVLYWGILGALVMRGAFIFAGAAALNAYEPAIYGLAALLIFTALKMAFGGEGKLDPAQSRVYRLLKKRLPLTDAPHEGHFFHKVDGKRFATTLLFCLLMIEATDVLFALDSVPAVLGVTTDPFIVYTSNIFAILGLRSLFFVVHAGLKSLHYLKPALVILLIFIGVRMFLNGPWAHILEITVTQSLLAVVGILGLSIVASKVHAKRHPEEPSMEAVAEEMIEGHVRPPPLHDAPEGAAAPPEAQK